MSTCEDQVAQDLFLWFSARPNAKIISYHPPSSKSYPTDLLRIPRKVRGVRTRERYHIDLVVVEEVFLFLIEFKCKLSESVNDITKLREIEENYSLEELIQYIQRRTTVLSEEEKSQLGDVQYLILSLGFRDSDFPLHPSEFVLFSTTLIPPSIHIGPQVPPPLKTMFKLK